MFIILPHSADVGWGRMPWLVFALMVLCTAIYFAQDRNKAAVDRVLVMYCAEVHDEADAATLLQNDADYCQWMLAVVHARPEKERFREQMLAETQAWRDAGAVERGRAQIDDLFTHYEQVRPQLPRSLDAALMTDPLAFNPWRAITSSLAHGSWAHLIGNMIFFFAFAPALEMVIGSRLRFALAMVVIALVADVAYFLAVHLSGMPPLPALGFSGVVTGMIGMSAYLLPRVRIRTFVWIMHLIRNFHIPAAVLAAWYIGWDAWYMVTDDGSSSTNFVAHVFGGVAGYLLGRLWFADRKRDIQDEVDDEVEYRRSRRNDTGILSSFQAKNPRSLQADRELAARRDFAGFMQQLYRAVDVGNDAQAVNLLLSRYDEYRHAIELYEEIYREMQTWKPSRTVFCLARLLITEYIAQRKYARASEVVRWAREQTPEFVFAEPGQAELLAAVARPING